MARPSPVRAFQDLYAASLGVALVLAVEHVIDVQATGAPLHYGAIPMFLAFVLVAFPAFHWAARFLDFHYVERTGRVADRFAVARDMVIGVTEILLLIGLSALIARPYAFLIGLCVFFGFETLASLVFRNVETESPIARFAVPYLLLNVIPFVAYAVCAIVIRAVVADPSNSLLLIGLLAMTVALGRLLALYSTGYEVFFPGGRDERSD